MDGSVEVDGGELALAVWPGDGPTVLALHGITASPPAALLGPAFERLTRVFPSREDYARFWQGHPAFAGVWNDDIAAYVDYDLEPADGGFRPAANPDAVAADLPEQLGFDWYHRAMAGLRQPVTVLRAPLGLLADPPGIYPPGVLEGFRAEIPQLEVVEVPDVNHYTLMMTSPGVDRVAEAVVAATTES